MQSSKSFVASIDSNTMNPTFTRTDNKENVSPYKKKLVGKRKSTLNDDCINRVVSSENSQREILTSKEFNKSLSFNTILKLLVAPAEVKTAKENPQLENVLQPVKTSSTKTSSESVRTNSFELMLNAFLTPPCTQTRSEMKKNDDDTFNVLVNKILTPEFCSQNRQNIVESSQTTVKHNRNQQTKLKKRIITPEEDSAYGMNFEQLLSQAFSSDLSSNEGNFDLKKQSSSGEEKSQSIASVAKVEHTKNRYKKQKIEQCTAIREPTEQTSVNNEIIFNQLLSQAFVLDSNIGDQDMAEEEVFDSAGDNQQEEPNPFNSTQDSQVEEININNTAKEKGLKEMSTQTSFSELSMFLTPSIRQNEHTVNNNHVYAPFMYNELISCSFTHGEEINRQNNTQGSSVEDTLTPQQSQTDKHILDILSKDVTLLPDGRKIFNNIHKVGTMEWLDCALIAAANLSSGSSKKIERREIMEGGNTHKMYVDYITKVNVKHYIRNNVKICTIKKSNVSDDNETVSSDDFDKTSLPEEELSETAHKLKTGIDKIYKNVKLIPKDYTVEEIDKTKIQIKIHDIFAKLYDAFESKQSPVLMIRTVGHQPFKNCSIEEGRLQYGSQNSPYLKKVNFMNKLQRKSFCRILYMLGKIYDLLKSNAKLTKREIFYQIKPVVGKQCFINSAVEDVTRLLGIGHWHLNVISHTGLAYGDLKLIWRSGEVTNYNTPATILIPNSLEDVTEVHTSAYFILVVEKESIFRKLLDEDLPNKLARPFIMITGKGMPDISTRLFVSKISRMMSLPVFILVDADPSGMRIMLTYRFGSITSCHLSEDLASPNARWLGVYPSEITKYGMAHQKLTKRDKIAVNNLRKNPHLENYPKILAELQVVSNSDRKASVEGLIKNNTFLSETYLPMKFFNEDFI